MSSLFKIVKKVYLIILIILFFGDTTALAKIFDEIKVEGNQRLSVETVVMFSGLKIGENLSENDLNKAIKNLYKTNFFKDIKIIAENNILKILIVENPIIQSIKINGIKNKTILDKLQTITKKMKNIHI